MSRGLHAHFSNRLEELAGILAAALRESGGDPLAPAIVVVQTPGVARWLSLALADRLGASMGVKYLFPRNFIDEICSKLPRSDLPAHPDCEEIAWRIFRMLPSLADECGDPSLAGGLEGGGTTRRYQLARLLADLYDRYLVHRPEMIAAWENGAEPRDWQAILWRRLCAEKPVGHLASILPRLETALAEAGELPARVFLFGVSTLPKLYFDFLQILGGRVRIDLFALAPSAQYWGDIQSARRAKIENALGIDPGFGQILLSSMGAQGRDFFNLLDDAGFNPESEIFVEPGEDTMLRRLQSDVLNMRRHAGNDAPDDSIEVVACAGPMRETEVLRDHILRLFESDPELRSRDILVLAPDIGVYAPYVEAVFGGVTGARIPYSLADRTVREEPLAGALARAFDLALSRRTSREVFSLFEHPALAKKFDLDADTLSKARRMCLETGVRWGFDAADREKLGFGPESLNSWKAGMDALALGAMMDGSGVFENTAPYADAEGDSLDAIGGLLGAYAAVRDAVRAVEADRPLSEWPAAFETCAKLLLPDDIDSAGERAAISAAVAKLATYAQYAGDNPIDLPTARLFLEEILGESLAPRGFLSGRITFAQLKPMRSVPAKAICLIGMDDEAFPRQDRAPSFDRIREKHREGDRSVREGDRYLFLETLLCARERLYISYSGISQHGDADTPPSVVVTELLEYLGGGVRIRNAVVRHPLQPFSTAYFRKDSPVFSYSAENFEAARAGLSVRAEPEFCPRELAGPPEALLSIDFGTLVEFFRHPAKFFLKNAVGLTRPLDETPLDEDEPRSVDSLERYNQRARLVETGMRGEGGPGAIAPAVARGVFPWGPMGEAEASSIVGEALVFCNAVAPVVSSEPVRANGAAALVEGGKPTVNLNLSIGPIHDGALVYYRCAKLRTKDRLNAWLAAIALAALRERGFQGATAAKGVAAISLDGALKIGLPSDGARRLDDLLCVYREGLTRPLPIFIESSFAACVSTTKTKKSPYERALEKWRGEYFGKSEYRSDGDDPFNRVVWRGREPIEECTDEFLELADRIWRGYEICAKEGF